VRHIDPNGQESADILQMNDIEEYGAGKISSREMLDRGVARGWGTAVGLAGGVGVMAATSNLMIASSITGLAYMAAPTVTDPRLQNSVSALFQSTDKLPGGTAGAIQVEINLGRLVSGTSHIIKGLERLQRLDKLIARGNLGAADQVVAQGLRGDLVKSLQPLVDQLKLPASEILKGMINGSIALPPAK